MADLVRIPAFARPIPWRTVGLFLTMLLLVVAALAALLIGSGSRVPPPFGLATPGLVAYGSDGDILTIEATTGRTRTVVGGPDVDTGPVWSLDGRHLAFVRGNHHVVVVAADGSGAVTVARDIAAPVVAGFSPDGRLVLIQDVGPGGAGGSIWLANTDGSGLRRLAQGMTADDASFRPPDGRQIVFRGATGRGQGIYAMDVDGTNRTTLVEPHPVDGMGAPTYSPDGRLITYNRWVPSDVVTSQQHVMAADGTDEVVLPRPEGALWHSGGRWSNDSKRLLFFRGYGNEIEHVVLAVVPADGSNTGVESGPPPPVTSWDGGVWAPDDSVVIGSLIGPDEQVVRNVVWNPATGEISEGWPASSEPSWQRAP